MLARIIFLIMLTFIYASPAYFIHRFFISLYPAMRHISGLFITLLLFSYPLGKIFIRASNVKIGTFFESIGAYFLFYYTYAILFFLLYLLLKLSIVDFQEFFLKNKNVFFLGFIIIVGVLAFIGYERANNIRLKFYNLKNENISGSKRIVFFSDVHLTSNSSKDIIKNLQGEVEKLNPDFILIGGDIIDSSVKLIRHDYISDFKKISSQFDVFTVIGNHEYYGDFEENMQYIRDMGIEILYDEAVEYDNFFLVGRTYGYGKKESLEKLLEGNNDNKEVIVIDHSPKEAREAIKNEIFLQVSGHTHNGQFFPYNLITRLLYTPHWGIHKEGRTNIITSCGLGYWAIPIRFPSYSELVIIDIN